MTKLSRRQVEARAWGKLQQEGFVKPPIRVDRLAQQLGYRIVYQRLAGDLSGTVMRDADGSVTIGINSFHASVRQRFSIAHEIAHADMHLTAKSDLFVDPPARVLFRDGMSSLGEDPVEIQANQYAAALLMPQALVAEAGQRMTDRNPRLSVDQLVANLAKRFEVSTQAMRYRLVTFGVLEPE